MFGSACSRAGRVGGRLAELAQTLPPYETNIAQKINSLRGTAAGSGIVGRASVMLKQIGNEITKTRQGVDDLKTGSSGAPNAREQKRPLLVEIRQTDPSPLEIVERIIGPLLQPLTTAGIVIVFVIFFLLQRTDLRDRFIRLAGSLAAGAAFYALLSLFPALTADRRDGDVCVERRRVQLFVPEHRLDQPNVDPAFEEMQTTEKGRGGGTTGSHGRSRLEVEAPTVDCFCAQPRIIVGRTNAGDEKDDELSALDAESSANLVRSRGYRLFLWTWNDHQQEG
jgi:hypothetical protein